MCTFREPRLGLSGYQGLDLIANSRVEPQSHQIKAEIVFFDINVLTMIDVFSTPV